MLAMRPRSRQASVLAISVLLCCWTTQTSAAVHHEQMVWHLRSDATHHEPGRHMLQQPSSVAAQQAPSCADRRCRDTSDDTSITNYGTYVPGFLPFGVLPSCPTKTAGEGQQCGAKIAKCGPGLCCSQRGFCSKSPAACGSTCQCHYSGDNSPCRGRYPLPTPDPKTLPTSKPGGVCSPFVANCPRGQCCTQFGICAPSESYYCSQKVCVPGELPKPGFEKFCKAAEGVKRKTRVLTLKASWGKAAPDGHERPVITINGKFPAAPIIASVGDRLIVTFVNDLQEPASIHWHGFIHRTTATADGVPPVTQQAVMPGESFVYNFVLDAPGTYWWHSHVGTQYMDGLKGLLVVQNPFEQQYPAELTLDVYGWYHKRTDELLKWFLSINNTEGDEPNPQNVLINGVAQAPNCASTHSCKYTKLRGVASDCSNPKTRIRIANTGGLILTNVTVDDHRMIVVGVDAVPVEPFEVGSIRINNGQRYDVLVCSKAAAGPSTEPVWIRAFTDNAQFANPLESNTTLAVLYFNDADMVAGKLPTTKANYEAPGLSATELGGSKPGFVVAHQVLKVANDANLKPPPATRTIELVIDMFDEQDGVQYAHFNNVSLEMKPDSPSLLSRIFGEGDGTVVPSAAAKGRGWNIVKVKRGEVIDFVINNHDDGEHPIHVHGHWAWVMDAGGPNAGDFKPSANKPLTSHFARDTATVNGNSYLVLRYVADNPGTWIVHCHIDWHLAAGLGFVVREGI